jgi:hypothetical protein
MPSETIQRRYVRFSLDIPAFRRTERGEKISVIVHQISLGGCLISWLDDIYTGDEFRLEVPLSNGNFLPLRCKALYKFPGKGIGAKFLDITKFEQELLAKVITDILEKEGLPASVDPFATPPPYIKDRITEEDKLNNPRLREEVAVEKILSSDK